MDKTELRKNLNAAVNAYADALRKKFDWAPVYGHWVGNDCLGHYFYEDDYCISLAEMVFIVDSDVNKEDFVKWYDYCNFAREYNQNTPSLESWVRGCPRLSEEQQNKLRDLREQFEKVAKDFKEMY